MYGRIAEKIAHWCCDMEEEKKDDYVIVSYGWGVILENITKMIILIGIGVCFKQLEETAIILISFCVVRGYAGGAHAKSTVGCTIVMVMVVLGGIIINQAVKAPAYVYIFLGGVSNTLIWLYAPNGNEACELLLDKEIQRKKRCAIGVVNIFFSMSCLFQIQNLVFFSITMEAISLLLFEIQRRKEYGKEKVKDIAKIAVECSVGKCILIFGHERQIPETIKTWVSNNKSHEK